MKFFCFFFNLVRELRRTTVQPLPPPPPPPPPPQPPRNLPLWSQNVPWGVPNTISLVPRTAMWMHCSYSPLRKGTLSQSLTERRSLMHHLNHLYIIVLLHNGPNVVCNMLGDSFRIIWNKQTLNSSIRWNLVKVFMQVL